MTELPEQIGDYRVEARLDKAGHNGVYKAVGAGTQALAIKLYPTGESDVLRARRLEILAATSELDQENVARVLDSGEHEGRVYAVMEFVQGSSLRKVLTHRRLDTRDVIEVLRGTAKALGHAYGKGLPCEGVDSDRILVRGDGHTVKVIDVGMPMVPMGMDSGSTATLHSLGAVRYLAPERMARPDDAPSQGALVYSLGVVGYELLTGTLPVGGFRIPSQVRGEVPPEIDPLILRCLAEDPQERFADPRALVAALDDLVLRVPALQARIGEGAAARVQATARNRKVLFAGGVVAALAILVLAMRGC